MTAARPTVSVLLVEDDDAEALYISTMLKRAEEVEFEIKHVVSLKAALTVIDAVRPDIVLLDLSLPDVHGYETATEFAKNTDVPFIVLTGNDDLQMAMRTTALGAQDYLLKGEVQAKPLERVILMAVRRAVRQEAQRRRARETMVQLIPPDKATVAMLQPRVRALLESFEDLENFLRTNAPGLMEDVTSLLDKHDTSSAIKEIRDLIRDEEDSHRPKSVRPPRKLSDAALKVMDDITEKKGSSEPPKTWEEAEKMWDEVIARGESR